jgi:predicted N-acetyltransferase YhbS
MRPANCSEAPLLSELAFRSKAYWGYSAEFIEACREELWVSAKDIDDPASEFVACEVGGSVIGYCAIEPISQNQYELEALFVEPQHIGCGNGRVLIKEAKKLAAQRGAESLLIQGDPNAEKFCLGAGGVKIGERESESIPGRFLPEFRIHLLK